MELAMLFPKGHSLHVPSDGRPLTPADHRVAMARLEASGGEKPWALTHKQAGPMLASLTPVAEPPLLQRTSLKLEEAAPAKQTDRLSPMAKPESLARQPAEAPEPQLAEEGEEQEDEIGFEPLPATFLLAEKPLSYSDVPDGQAREPVLRKLGLLMAPASVLASEEFDHRLQIEDLYEANSFKGRAIAFMERRRAHLAAVAKQAGTQQAMK
jgi:hypothetical protein